uniref:Uncharacterized protein n=1 Tax=Tanacetum cinerariifolium TaxID=118510 RepID=A0A6L2NH01_TANCI|nr:hypothetical protein [Tanacetum cinerariifolium]
MAYDSSRSLSSNSKVTTCSKSCLKIYETLKKQYDDLRIELYKYKCNLADYKRGLASVEEQLVHYKQNESLLNEKIDVLKRDLSYKDSEIVVLKSKLDKISKEKDDLNVKIEKFDNASQSLDKLIGSQITDNSKRGLGYFVEPSNKSYRVKPIKVVTQKSSVKISAPIRENNNAPLIKDWESKGDDEVKSTLEIERKTIASSVDKARCKYHQRERMVNGTNHSRMYLSANIVPNAVLTRTGLKLVNSVRPVNLKRSFQRRITYNNRNFFQKVNTVLGNKVYVVKASGCWVWRPKQNDIDHVTKQNSASITLKRFNYIDVQGIANQNMNQTGNGNVVAARAEGNGNGNYGTQIRCYNYRGLGHYARNCTVRLRRMGCYLSSDSKASTTGIQNDNAPIYDSNGSAEAKFDELETDYRKYVYQEECLTKKINALHLRSAKQIMALKEEISNLNNELSKEKSMVSLLQEKKKMLKSDFKRREDETGSFLWGYAFLFLFGEKFQLFKNIFDHNIDQLKKQLDKKELHECDSKTCVAVLKKQFEKFFDSKSPLSYSYQYQSELALQKEKFQENVVKQMNEIELQKLESMMNVGTILDDNLDVTEQHGKNNSPRNDTDAEGAKISKNGSDDDITNAKYSQDNDKIEVQWSNNGLFKNDHELEKTNENNKALKEANDFLTKELKTYKETV